ncbi:hypothetical protein BH24PSE2_BH24PSE2_21270 [soil metagenome]
MRVCRSAGYLLTASLFVCLPLRPAAAIEFEDVSDVTGVSATRSETWGASWGDFNGDGWPDVFVNFCVARAGGGGR